MSPYDIFMLIIFLSAVLFGYWKGLAWQIASMASIFISYLVALNFSAPLARFIGVEAPMNKFIAMLILFLGTSLIVWLIFGRVRESIKKMHLKSFDRQIGALMGAAKGVLLCMVVTMFAVTLLGDNTRASIFYSRSGGYITRGIDKLTSMVPQEFHGVIGPYIERYEAALRDGQSQLQTPGNPNGSYAGNPNGGQTMPAGYSSNANPNSGNSTGGNIGSGSPYSNPAGGVNYQSNQPNYGSQPGNNQQTGGYQDIPGQWQQPANNNQWSNQSGNNRNSNYGTPWPNQQQSPQYYPSGYQQNSGYGNQPQSGQYSNQPGAIQPAPSQQTQQSGQLPYVTQGENGLPQFNYSINTEDLLKQGAEAIGNGARSAIEGLLEPAPAPQR